MTNRYLVQMQLQKNSRGIKLPEVHGVKKTLNTNTLPKKQKLSPQIKKNVKMKLRLGHGRTGKNSRNPKLQKN